MNYFRNINSENELKKKYRELVKEYHPDKGGDPEVFNEVTNQYEMNLKRIKGIKINYTKGSTTEIVKYSMDLDLIFSFLPDSYEDIMQNGYGIEGRIISTIRSIFSKDKYSDGSVIRLNDPDKNKVYHIKLFSGEKFRFQNGNEVAVDLNLSGFECFKREIKIPEILGEKKMKIDLPLFSPGKKYKVFCKEWNRYIYVRINYNFRRKK